MKFVSPNAEVSLAAVRELSENAVNRPWDRKLRCLPWPPAPAGGRLVEVWQPWKRSALSMWRGFVRPKDLPATGANDYANRTWINPM